MAGARTREAAHVVDVSFAKVGGKLSFMSSVAVVARWKQLRPLFVASGPDEIVLHDRSLFVRTYDTDLVFDVR